MWTAWSLVCVLGHRGHAPAARVGRGAGCGGSGLAVPRRGWVGSLRHRRRQARTGTACGPVGNTLAEAIPVECQATSELPPPSVGLDQRRPSPLGRWRTAPCGAGGSPRGPAPRRGASCRPRASQAAAPRRRAWSTIRTSPGGRQMHDCSDSRLWNSRPAMAFSLTYRTPRSSLPLVCARYGAHAPRAEAPVCRERQKPLVELHLPIAASCFVHAATYRATVRHRCMNDRWSVYR